MNTDTYHNAIEEIHAIRMTDTEKEEMREYILHSSLQQERGHALFSVSLFSRLWRKLFEHTIGRFTIK